ncbi:MAG: hypothetical protein J6U64_01400 [Alphaproteobacteria bacterium]|nr:hypothetical protein [Alphaproteobacteria bacterium]
MNTMNEDKDIEVLKALPALQKIWNTPSLSEYFTQTVAPLAEMEDMPEKRHLTKAIAEETERLHGKETAEGVKAQLSSFPVVETGTHLAFLRDYDTPKKDDLRSRLNQNVLISSALMRDAGQKYHIGVYGSNVSMNHPCGGGFFQLGNDIFPVMPTRQVQQVCLYNGSAIDKKFFNTSLPLVAKLRMLKSVLEEEVPKQTDTIQREALKKLQRITDSLLAPVADSKTAYSDVEKQFNNLNPNNREMIKRSMLAYSAHAYKKYGITFSDVDQQYAELSKVFDRTDLNLPDQVALVQSKDINKALEGTDVQHLSVDGVEVARKFLISALEDKESLWYKTFSNSDNFKKLHQSFIGIRGSWKAEESPFDFVGNHKGYSKTRSLPLEAMDHKPETLIPLLKEKKVIPSCSMIMLVFQSAGMMAHGGFFQTTYAEKVKNQFKNYLNDIGEQRRAEQVGKLPVDMALLSLAVANDRNGNPMKLSEISRMSSEKRKELLDSIPSYPSCRAVSNALPTLRKYLSETAPGYVEKEASGTRTPRLICPAQDRLDRLVNAMKHYRELERAV